MSNINQSRGRCYHTSEAIYHLWAKKAGFKPCVMKHEGDTHWFLRRMVNDKAEILDLTVKQFKKKPDYNKARGCGFLTKKPSKPAKVLMNYLIWQG